MNELLVRSTTILAEAGFTTEQSHTGSRESLVFEDATTLGFIFAYGSPTELIASWENDANAVVAGHQFGLRRAGQKAWNTYIVLLSQDGADYKESAALAAIEENLSGTRKVVRAGIKGLGDVRAALLPLLPLQSAPKLEVVDIMTEIRQRASELPSRAVDAYLSSADESAVIQALEDMS